jgi:tetratricopeptide (TPR) repeat protein
LLSRKLRKTSGETGFGKDYWSESLPTAKLPNLLVLQSLLQTIEFRRGCSSKIAIEGSAPEGSASQEESVMARPLQEFALAMSVVVVLPSALPAAEEDRGASVFEGRPYQLQMLDDPAPLLVPVNPRTVEIEQLGNAAAWFMTGRLHQQRERFDEALKAYEKAAALEPGSIEIIRAMIDMALRLDQGEKALKYAIDAVELDPDDFQLLRQLGVEMVRGRKLDQAIKYLEQARSSPKLKELSGFYVLINRDLGIIYKGLGEIEKAADAYEIVLAALLDPNKYGLDRRTRDELQKHRSTSYEQIGQVFLQANRNDLALTALEKASAERSGKPGGVNYLLAQLYFQKEDYTSALKQIDIFFGSKLDKGRGPYRLLQQILVKTEQEDSLATRLEELVKNDPTNREAKSFLAEAYLEKDRLEEAEEIFTASLKDGPSPAAYLGLAQIYRRQMKAAELLENISKVYVQAWQQRPLPEPLATELEVLQKDKTFQDDFLKIIREQTADGAHAEHFGKLLFVAEVVEGAKRTEDAAEMYRLALTANPAQASIVYRALGELFMATELYTEAAAVYREAAGKPLLQGAKPDNLLRLALALELSGETDPALEAIADAITLVPGGHPLLAFREAWIYYHAHRMAEAAKKFEAFIAKWPTSEPWTKQAKFSLSAVYVQLGDLKRGEDILEKFLAENPDDIGVNNDLGYLYADQGKNLEKARKMIQKAVDAEPENAAYLDSLGWVLFKLGEHKEAITWLKKATKLETGNDATIWEHLGDCYGAIKETPDATKAWEKALELVKEESHPDAELIKRVEEKLKAQKSDVGKVKTESTDDP